MEFEIKGGKSVSYSTDPLGNVSVQETGAEYVIPLSSAKEKHKAWKNVEADRFLIFENCGKA